MKYILKIVTPLMFVLPFVALVAKAEITVGSPAPKVSGVDQDGKPVDLGKAYQEHKYVLVYFYPKADTPGCTAQACSLRDSFAVLQHKGVLIYGVSSDDVKAQKEFQKKHRLPFSLIADVDKKMIKAFGVPTTMGFAKRQAFLTKDGKVVWLDKEASTKEQADDIIKFLNSQSTK